MFGLDPFVEKAFEKIKDAGLAPVFQEQINLLREHVAFMAEKLTAAENSLAKAEGKLEAQAEEIEKLRSQLAAWNGKAKLVEIGPCFVKETSDGTPLEGVYCPDCKMPMDKGEYGASGELYYHCMKCDVRLPAEIVDSPLAAYHRALKTPD